MGSLTELFGTQGIVQTGVVGSFTGSAVPRVRWLGDALAPLGVGEGRCLQMLYAVYLTSLVGLLLGWQTRLMAIAAWLTHLTLKTSGDASAYGVSDFAHIALFYSVWIPVGRAWSLDVWSGRVSAEPSAGARLGLRLLQLHLCVVYLSSGLEKATGIQWWNGEAVWR